jgi:hypothetical protein
VSSRPTIPRPLWVLLAVAAVAGSLAAGISFSSAGEGRTRDRTQLEEIRCTQRLILSILNDPKVQQRIRAGQPIANPCDKADQ